MIPGGRFAWRHPEWWTLLVSAVSWMVLIYLALSPDPVGSGLLHADHAPPPDGGLKEIAFVWTIGCASWLLTTAAMMLPLALYSIRTTAERSLWSRRDRAIAEFVIGYLSVWLLLGAAVCGLDVLSGLDRLSHPTLAIAVGLAVAALWQLTPFKQRALKRCHQTMPLAPFGLRADRDCYAYGLRIGEHCFVNCWPLMLTCVLAHHSLPIMLSTSSVAIVERYFTSPRRRLSLPLIAAGTAIYVVLGFAGF